MSLSLRIFIAYFLLIGFSTWIVMQNITTELIPAMRQSLEEALVDSAYLMRRPWSSFPTHRSICALFSRLFLQLF